MDRFRILVVAALGHFVAPMLESALDGCQVTTVTSPEELRPAVANRPRFDVAIMDVTWNDSRYEWTFDGIDGLATLREENRPTAVVMAAQGHGFEDDHIAEATDTALWPDVVGLVNKTDGLPSLTAAIRTAVTGGRLPAGDPSTRPPLHTYFAKGRGRTAARLAAAVASGRAAHYRDLAEVAQVAPDTANKLVGYLGPIIADRNEAPPDQPITQPAVYRWCGEHARYLLSWQRRNDPTVITRWTTG